MKDKINIPLIDISEALTGTKDDRHRIAMEIDKACKDIGFFIVTGHGIPQEITTNAFKSQSDFFDLPFNIKNGCRAIDSPSSHSINGYRALLEENSHAYMGRKGPSDYVEKFSMERSILDDSLTLPFPDGEFGLTLRSNMKAYYQACEKLTDILTELFTIALDLPTDFFTQKIDQSYDFLRLLTYPARKEEFKHDQGVTEHTDGTLLTMVCQKGHGLKVRTTSGDLIQVETTEIDHFIVNIGDLLMRWSNDEWLSTPHKVDISTTKRESLIFFKLVNDETIIEAFPKFTKEKPAKYPPVRYKDYADTKMSALVAQGDAVEI